MGKGRRDRDGNTRERKGKEALSTRERLITGCGTGVDDENLRVSFCRTRKKNARDQIAKYPLPTSFITLALTRWLG
jgi:hypothetical protein